MTVILINPYALSIAGSDYELISTVTLSSDASSVDFTNIGEYSSTYKHLQIRASVRSTNSATTARILMRINGASSGYSFHGMFTRGSSVTSYYATNDHIRVSQDLMADGATANSYTAMILDILDAYNTSKTKVIRSLSGHNSASDSLVAIHSGMYNSTNSITSLSFSSGNNGWQDANNIKSGSRFSLYGIKG